MRLILACMVFCFAAGYSQDVVTTEENPVEVTTGDEGGKGEVATNDSLAANVDQAGCGCGKGKGK